MEERREQTIGAHCRPARKMRNLIQAKEGLICSIAMNELGSAHSFPVERPQGDHTGSAGPEELGERSGVPAERSYGVGQHQPAGAHSRRDWAAAPSTSLLPIQTGAVAPLGDQWGLETRPPVFFARVSVLEPVRSGRLASMDRTVAKCS